VKTAWQINPSVAVNLRSRFVNSLNLIDAEIMEHSKYFEIKVAASSDAVSYLLKNSWKQRHDEQLRYLLYWASVPPIIAINILGAQHTLQPWILQYGIRALYFPVEQAFFYIPQMVRSWLIKGASFAVRLRWVYPGIHTRRCKNFTAIRASNYLEHGSVN
jgi:hypothetical protein